MRFLLLLLASVCALAQTSPRYVVTTGALSLSASGTAVTIQQPASGSKKVEFESAYVYCSVACTVTQSQFGTAATTTAATPVAIAPGGPTATVKAFTASNVGSGTTISATPLAAGGSIAFDLKQVALNSSGTTNNYTVSVSSITGTAIITIFFAER